MPALTFILTTAGKAAIVNAVNTGTAPVVIERVAIGSASWTPTAAATALNTEIKQISAIGGGTVADDTIHVTANDSSTDVYTVKEVGLYTDDDVLLAIYSQADPIITKGAGTVALIAADLVITGVPAGSVTVGDTTFDYPQATETVKGVAEIATTAEAQAGTDDERIITPKKLQDVTATSLRKGVIQLASNAESQTGTDTAKAITPASLAARTATSTRAGLIEIASNAEVQDGTATDLAVTPAGLTARTATTDRTGIAELATDAEAIDGTEAGKIITPTALKALLAEYGHPYGKPITTGSNLNSIAVTGFYRYPGGGSVSNRPAEDSGSTTYDFDLIHIQAFGGEASQLLFIDGSQIWYRSSSSGTWSSWSRLITGSRVATATIQGIIELATNAEVQAGTDTERAVTPAGLASLTATGTRAGLVELATNAEIETGTDTARAITPAGLASRTASTSLAGLIEIATSTETNTGTDSTRAVTPNTLRLYPGTARGWVVFNGSGTVSITNSHGVTSVTDRGVGRYTINWDGVFGSSNYCYVACARQINDISDSCTVSPRASESKTTSALQISVTEGSDLQDSTEICVAAFA